MKLEKAIAILTKWREEEFADNEEELDKAEKLGIGALEARKVWQDNEGFDPGEALPGETEE